MDGSVMMLVEEYFGNWILKFLVSEVVNFKENCSIMMYKSYGGYQLFVYGLIMPECVWLWSMFTYVISSTHT